MRVKDILNTTRISFSFEFFPPKTETSWKQLFDTISELMLLKPSYVNVTYGAGGSTRDLTYKLVTQIQKKTGLTVVPHLSCIGSTKDEIKSILEKYSQSGIENILALRGDLPKDQKLPLVKGGFKYAADLVTFIKKHFPHMSIGVGGYPEGHPETPNRLKEIEYLKAKVDAGADYIVTQLFFDNRDFYDFCQRCELAGIHIPIIAGILPITSYQRMIRMAELAAGSRLPASLLKSIMRAESDEYIEKIGIHWATEQVRDLVDHNVRGIHFYTLNNSRPIFKIYEFLGVRDSVQLLAQPGHIIRRDTKVE
ncbi:MAG: methylenetetrahydrofolate reductase [NAD(P)H] [Deltaproteobacteria bacterium]|nr:methylenetetrahydrofolate reductase [NAD(P)H] [Deltaproteobacteria bacterium]